MFRKSKTNNKKTPSFSNVHLVMNTTLKSTALGDNADKVTVAFEL